VSLVCNYCNLKCDKRIVPWGRDMTVLGRANAELLGVRKESLVPESLFTCILNVLADTLVRSRANSS